MKKKYIIITGGSGGIGSEITNFLITKNFKLINLDNKKHPNKEVKNIKCDLENPKQIVKTFKKIRKISNNIYALINCAGCTEPGNFTQYSLYNWQKTLSVNLTAPFLLSQLIAKLMISKKINGSIINITSIAANVAMPNSVAYNVSKAGLKHLTKSLALDLAPYKIRVNNLSPGYTKTLMTAKSWKNKNLRILRTKRTMLNKWAETKDYNEAILFLIDPKKSGYMTGSDIIIDGGWLAKGL